MLFWKLLGLGMQQGPVFYGHVMRQTHQRKGQSGNDKASKKLGVYAGIFFGLCLLSLLIGAGGCVFTLVRYDQIFDWVVYVTVAVAAILLLTSIGCLISLFIKKMK